MYKKGLLISSGVTVVTILFVVAYSLFNALGVTQSRVVRNEITLVTEGSTKYYDGTPLSNSEWYMESGELAEGDVLVTTMGTEVTNPASVANEIGVTILNSEGENVTVNYKINYKLGRLTVKALELSIETVSASKYFDGSPLSLEGWQLQTGSLLEGDYFETSMTTSITEPGEIDNAIVLNIYNSEGVNVNNLYNITYNLGTLSILGRNITVITDTYTKGYDGEPLMGGDATVIGDVAETNYYELGPQDSLLDPGSKENNQIITIYDNSGNDITNYYEIEYDFGTLTVNPVELIITSGSDSKTYDGTPLSNDSWSLISGTVIEQHNLNVTLNSSITEVGSVDNVIYASIVDEDGNDVSYIYEIEKVPGTLEILAKDLLFETGTDEKVYDGSPLTSNDWQLIFGDIPESHEIVTVMTGTITNPGIVDNDLYVQILDENGNDVTDEYNIDVNTGTLKIIRRSITVSTESFEKGYDGTPLLGGEATLVFGDLVSGHEVEFGPEQSLTLPDVVDNEVAVRVVDEDGNDVTSFYSIDSNFGELTVHPIEIVISSESAEKTYDGLPLVNENWEFVHGDLLDGHSVDVTLSASITEVGRIPNTINATILDSSGVNVSHFYEITYDTGLLEVFGIDLIISSGSTTKEYDGLPLTNSNWAIVVGELSEGHYIEETMPSTLTDVGRISNEIIVQIFNEVGENVTDTYEINYNYGYLTVQAINLVVSTSTTTKLYDGTPLLGGEATLITGNLMDGHELAFGTESSITDPGSIDNEIEVTVIDELGNDVSNIYSITEDFGTLTVEKIQILLVSPSKTKVYDGAPLFDKTYTQAGNVIAGHTLVVSVDNEITDIGEIENTIIAYVEDASGNIVTDLYDIDLQPGTLQVFSSAYSSSQLATEGFDVPEVDVFEVYTDFNGLVYFRGKSEDLYTGSGWTSGIVQTTDITQNPFMYPGSALLDFGETTHVLNMRYLRDQVPFLTPYFSIENIPNLNDIRISGDTDGTITHNMVYYIYDLNDVISLEDPLLSSEELVYRDYVYQNYLEVPESTYDEMVLIALANGLSSDSPTLILDVQSYIQNAATYNLDFAPIPDGEDVAVYFLTESQEGICQHYATAATLMYRTLGVPARYTTGYVGNVQADQWSVVKSTRAHAWVEIYIDGIGWIPVEVTGSGDAVDTTVEDPEVKSITVTPNDVIEEYEVGKSISATSLTIEGYDDFVLEGYTYEVTYSGILSEMGTLDSNVDTFIIYDNNGIDVTDEFEITFNSGTLTMYGYNLTLTTGDAEKIYNGLPLQNTSYTLTEDNLAPGHSVLAVVVNGSQTNVGSSSNVASIVIIDELGNVVTNQYTISYDFGTLTVLHRTIEITSGSKTKIFDYTPLTDDSYLITDGQLATTDEIEIVISGSQIYIGRSKNTISSISITRDGTNVSGNYIIVLIEGDLIVNPY